MKIIMRHGKDRYRELPNNNAGSWIADDSLEEIAKLGVEIRSRFSCIPNVYVSSADRAIETAILVWEDGLSNLINIRKIICERIVAQNDERQGGNWYKRFAKDLLPINFYVVEELYDQIPFEVLADDNFIAVVHCNALEDFGFQLNYARFIESE